MSKKGGSKVAEQTRADELARQKRIREGTARINAIFDGGTYVSDPVASDATYDPSKTYYKSDGSVWTSPTGSSGTFADVIASAKGKSTWGDAVKNGLYTSVNTTPGQFGDDFFAQRQQSYLDYAKPQINDQYSDAQKELTFALARGGKLSSSTQAAKGADLQKMFDLQTQKATDDALNYSTQARTGVEDARANLITTLNATGDADQAVTSALARAQALSQPAAYSPLTDLFSSYVDALGAYSAAEKARSYGWGGNTTAGSPTYYGSAGGSVSVRK